MEDWVDLSEIQPIFLPEEYPKYKLVRVGDELTKNSSEVKWFEWGLDGKFESIHEDPAIGRSLIMSPFNQFFIWQTTPITKIVKQKEGYIKFKTENSTYELFKL